MARGLAAALLANLVLVGCFVVLYLYLPDLTPTETSEKRLNVKDMLSKLIVDKVIEFDSVNGHLQDVEEDDEEMDHKLRTQLRGLYWELQQIVDRLDPRTDRDRGKDQFINVVDSRGRQVRLMVKRAPVDYYDGSEEDVDISKKDEEVELFWFIGPSNTSDAEV